MGYRRDFFCDRTGEQFRQVSRDAVDDRLWRRLSRVSGVPRHSVPGMDPLDFRVLRISRPLARADVQGISGGALQAAGRGGNRGAANLIPFRGAAPLRLPYALSREPLRRLSPFALLAWLRSLAS